MNIRVAFRSGGRQYRTRIDLRLSALIPALVLAVRRFRLRPPIALRVTRCAAEYGHLLRVKGTRHKVLRLRWADAPTLAHELAHLRHWDHGKKHEDLEERILEFWRSRGLLP